MSKGNPMKAKGTRAESLVVAWLCAEGFPAKRKALTGANDEGDIEITGMALVIQSKWRASNPTAGELDNWLQATLEQAAAASFSDLSDNTFWLPVLVHNRPRCADVSKWLWYPWSARDRAYLRMSGTGFLEWLREVYTDL